jgi:hypothetical protein
MVDSQTDARSVGIHQPRFDLFQHVHVIDQSEEGYVFEGRGVICGLLVGDSAQYPSDQFLLNGWWYEVMFYELPTSPALTLPIREWVHESEVYPIASTEGGSSN